VIGDKANDMLLDMVDKVVDLNVVKDRRFRIEHAQHLAPGAANRFGKQGIIASVQVNYSIPLLFYLEFSNSVYLVSCFAKLIATAIYI